MSDADNTVSVRAAGGIVFNGNGEFLMMLRNGVWDLPKGKIEEDETTEQAAVREVSEETGIPVEMLILRGFVAETTHCYDTYGRRENKTTVWFAMNIMGMAELLPESREGITELRWVRNMDGLEPVWDNIRYAVEEWQRNWK